jgi:hypothetical protein
LPAYADKIWDVDNADYLHLMLLKEKRKKERESAAEAAKEDDGEEYSSDTRGDTEDKHVEDPLKIVKKYTFNTCDLGQFMRINLKLSVKKVPKKGPKPSKCDHSVWNALPWDGQQKSKRPTHPIISLEYVEGSFSWVKQDPTSEADGHSKSWILIGLHKRKAYEK